MLFRSIQLGQNDISCVPYNAIIKSRIVNIGINSQSLRNNPETGWVRPAAFASRPGVNHGTNNSAGARFTHLFPSQCFSCIIIDASNGAPRGAIGGLDGPNNAHSIDCSANPHIGINQVLLAKKNYMLQNNKNNVISGARAGPLVYATNGVGGGFGGGLTKAQIWSRVARGAAPSGAPAKRYGLQNFTKTTPNQFTNPNLTFGYATRLSNSLYPRGGDCK